VAFPTHGPAPTVTVISTVLPRRCGNWPAQSVAAGSCPNAPVTSAAGASRASPQRSDLGKSGPWIILSVFFHCHS
jgi:hypothetical protein